MKIDKQKLAIAMGNSCITFNELSIKSGVSRITIGKFLSGKVVPRPATIGKIAKALNVKVEDLIEN
jgi:transcriptional regulator with XRE-family HTH domain